MICQTNDPTKMIDLLAYLILKDQSISACSGMGDVLAFVPTRRAARKLERVLAKRMGGAAVMPKIVGLGEGADDEDDGGAIGNLERKIILAGLLMPVAENVGAKCGFAGALNVAAELTTLEDYLENEGIDALSVDWPALVADERKAAFLNVLAEIDWGRPTAAAARNRGIRGWAARLGDYGRVYLCGSTASVAATRELMARIAGMPNGCVILPGMVENFCDIGRTDPYWSIKRFLKELKDIEVKTIDHGGGRIRFFNRCFDNGLEGGKLPAPDGITRVDCRTEAEEAAAVAAICAGAKGLGETALVITPDSAGGQRIRAALSARDLSVDSSDGTPLSKTELGRLALLAFDYVLENEKRPVVAADLMQIADFKDQSVLDGLQDGGSLLDFVADAVSIMNCRPAERVADAFFGVVSEWSGIAQKYNLGPADSAELLKDALAGESVRATADECDVAILGTAEARMQSADVVILTGLNDGMFPGNGFEHDWLPRDVMHKIGLPSADSKVSLMALDFMTLSSGPRVYWTRSETAGGSETTPSRFLSRVGVRADIPRGTDLLAAVRVMDDPPPAPLPSSPPSAKYSGEYWATWIEDLIHNPYQFYARHILHLRRCPDIGDDVGAREFGTIVHGVLENLPAGAKADEIVRALESEALRHVGRAGILFRFWQNRFREMAPAVADMLAECADALVEQRIETGYLGKRLIAKADRILGRRVIDYKTGAIPGDSQLGLGKDENCTMPQLPLEAMILADSAGGGVEMAFLALQKKHVGLRVYDAEKTARAIAAVKKKLSVVLNIDEYGRPEFVDEKYRDFDDLCRAE
jgi:ATP-dependent helicase/nuclease subunit B